MGVEAQHMRQERGVNVSFSGTTASFRYEGRTVAVPGTAVERSRLLADMRKEDISDEELLIPLSIAGLEAWLLCLDVEQDQLDDCSLSDHTLVHALEAADFLQDDRAKSRIIHALSLAFAPWPAPDPVETSDESSHAEASDEDDNWEIEEGVCYCDELAAEEGSREIVCDVCTAANHWQRDAAADVTSSMSTARLQRFEFGDTPAAAAADSECLQPQLLEFFRACHMLGPLGYDEVFERNGACSPGPAPTAAQRLRVQRILEVARPPHVMEMLYAIPYAPDPKARFELDYPIKQAAVLHQLLLLVPPSLHAAVLHARCPSIARDRSLSLRYLPPFDLAASPANGPAKRCTAAALAIAAVADLAVKPLTPARQVGNTTEQRHATEEGAADVAQLTGELTSASLLTTTRTHDFESAPSVKRARLSQELAAGAAASSQNLHVTPIRQGSIRSADDAVLIKAARLLAEPGNPRDPPLPTPSDLMPAAALDPAAGLTRLSLAVTPQDACAIFTFVRHLRMLRTLRLDIVSVERLDMLSFGSTLQTLPELAALHVTAQRQVSLNTMLVFGLHELLAIVSRLPGLAALSLEHCWERPCRGTEGGGWSMRLEAATALAQLSALTRLTYLSLKRNASVHTEMGTGLCAALRPLKQLQHAALPCLCGGADAALAVLSNGTFTALRSLDLVDFEETLLRQLVPDSVAPGVGCGLTALSMRHGRFSHGRLELARCIEGSPALQRLCCGDVLQVGVLQGLAAALQHVPDLRQLEIHCDLSASAGCLAVLEAAAQLHASAEGGLRRLTVRGAALGDTSSRLAAVLEPLVTLQEVHLLDAQLTVHGMRDVLCALPGLPQLHTLTLSAERVDEVSIMDLVPALRAATSLQHLAIAARIPTRAQHAVRQAIIVAAPWLSAVTLGEAPLQDGHWADLPEME